MQGGTQQRDGVDLVPCADCRGNVRLKVPKPEDGVTMPLSAPVPAGPSIIVVDSVYYERPGRDTIGVDSRFLVQVAADEQPYIRQIRVTETWGPLGLAWITETGCGHIVIANDEGRHWDKIPTAEERAEAARRVVEVSLSPLVDQIPEWEIAPGRSMRGTPARPIFLRCRPGGGVALVTVSAFPR